MKLVKLIINADDLGASKLVNDSTFRLMENGSITSATLIANSPEIIDACARVKAFPSCSFGVHLNITEYTPLNDSPALYPLLSENGEFAGEESVRSANINGQLSKAIYDEFELQIGKLISLGVLVDHIDSHHHVHNIPRLFRVLKRIQKKFQIRKVRISRNLYNSTETTPRLLKLKKIIYNEMLRRYYHTETTEGFSDFLLFHQNAYSGRLKHRILEAMVHPGNPYYSEEEENLVATDWRYNLETNIELINYRQLGSIL